MFGIKTKKRVGEEIKEEIKAETSPADNETALTLKEEKEEKTVDFADGAKITPAKDKKESADKTEKLEDVSDFYCLADILCTDKTTVLEECKLFQIRKIMAKVSRAVVRYGLSNAEIKALVNNAAVSGLSEIAVSPAYLNDIAANLKGREDIKVCAVIDFPFGEASFKVKMSEIKNSVKQGVDGVLTVINASEIKNENTAAIKKQLRKLGKVKGVERGVAVSAEDLGKEDIKRFLRFSEKVGFDYAAFLFGNVSESGLDAKMKEIMAVKGKTPVKVMANAEDVFGVKALIKHGADGIITPFADRIAKELFDEFKINGTKLV